MRVRTALAPLLAGALFLTACGGSSEEASPEATGSESATAAETGTAAPTEGASQPELVSEDLPEGVAATVGGEEISVEALEERMAVVREVPQVKEQLEGENADQVESQLQTQALGQMVLQRVVIQGATTEDVEVDDEQVADRRAELEEEAGGAEAFTEQLASAGVPESQFPTELRASLAFELVTEKLLEDEGIDPEAASAAPTPSGTESPSANPQAQQAQQIQQGWLVELVSNTDVVVDEAYGAWNPQSGQVVPA